MTERGSHLVLYDGSCGLCGKTVRFVLDRDPEGRFRFAPLQGRFAHAELARWGKDADALDTVYVIADAGTERERLLDRGLATAFMLHEIGGVWRWVSRLLTLLPRSLLDAGYDFVARNRDRIPVPRAERPALSVAERERFIDA
jgi:predicted DCC family thiol-disulfide oxidoreductase YuxK